MGMPIITPGTGTRCQAITDMIASVALEQTALSHILNAEGEKIQKIIALDAPPTEMLRINQSVNCVVKAITSLEMILQSKLERFKECLCKDCADCPPVEVVIFNSSGTANEVEPNVFSIGVNPSQSTTIQTTPLSTITNVSLDTGFTRVGDQLIAPPDLIPFQVYTNIFNINETDGPSPCAFQITIRMVYANT